MYMHVYMPILNVPEISLLRTMHSLSPTALTAIAAAPQPISLPPQYYLTDDYTNNIYL